MAPDEKVGSIVNCDNTSPGRRGYSVSTCCVTLCWHLSGPRYTAKHRTHIPPDNLIVAVMRPMKKLTLREVKRVTSVLQGVRLSSPQTPGHLSCVSLASSYTARQSRTVGQTHDAMCLTLSLARLRLLLSPQHSQTSLLACGGG